MSNPTKADQRKWDQAYNDGTGASTITLLADILEISPRKVAELVRIYEYKKDDHDGLYDVNFFQKKIADTKSRVKSVGGIRIKGQEFKDDLIKHETRYKKARADREELKAKLEKGTQVDLVKVRKEQVSREMAFKKAFMNLPRNMATRLVGCGSKEIEAVLTKYVTEAFRKMIVGK